MPDPSQTPTHIGGLLRHIRKSLALTLRQAAAAGHVNFTYLAQVERGEREPSSEWLSAYVKSLGAEVAHRDVAA